LNNLREITARRFTVK